MARTSALCQLLLLTCCISLVVVNAMPMPSRDDSSESSKERFLESSMEAGGCATGGCQPVGCPTGGCQPTGCPTGGCLGESRELQRETSSEVEAGERVAVSVEDFSLEYEDPACIDVACRTAAAARRPCTTPACRTAPIATRTSVPAPHRKPAARKPSPATAPAPCTQPSCAPVAPPAPCLTCKTVTCTTPGCATA